MAKGVNHKVFRHGAPPRKPVITASNGFRAGYEAHSQARQWPLAPSALKHPMGYCCRSANQVVERMRHEAGPGSSSPPSGPDRTAPSNAADLNVSLSRRILKVNRTTSGHWKSDADEAQRHVAREIAGHARRFLAVHRHHGSNSISPDPDLRRGPRPCGPAERNDAFSRIGWHADDAHHTWFGPNRS